jgi:pyrroloquinoline quinone biosynthesis protein D
VTPPALDAVVRRSPLYLLRWEPTQDAHVLLYPEGVVKLSPTAAAILERCDGGTVRALLKSLADEFPDDDVAKDVLEFLEVARDRGWIHADP